MHFLSAAELDHLHALEMAGKAGEAQLELAQKLTAFLPNQTQQMGLLEKAWDGLRKGASATWDAMLGIGKTESPDEKLNALTNRMAILKFRQTDRSFWSVTLGLGGDNANDKVEMADIQKKIDALQAPIAAALKKSAADAAAAAKNTQQQAALDLINANSPLSQIADLEAELKLVQAFEAGTDSLARRKADAIKALNTKISDLLKRDAPKPKTYTDIFDDMGDVAYRVDSKDKSTAKMIENQQSAYKSMEQEMANERAKALKDADALDVQINDAMASTLGKLGGDAYMTAFAGVQKTIEGMQNKLDSIGIKGIDPARYDRETQAIDALANAKMIDATATAAQQSIQQIENDRSEALKELQAEVTAGMLTQDDARRQGIIVSQTALLALQDHLEVLKSLAADGYAPAIEAQKKFAATLATIADAAKDKSWADGLSAGLKSYAGAAVDTFKTVKDATEKAMKGMEDALLNFVKTGKLNFGSLASSIIDDLMRIQIQNSITKPLSGAMSGFDFSSLAKIFTASAQGNVFASPGLHAYANSVVSSPTLFPFASGVGLMGEAGPEAIMPLTRGPDGRLGVSGGAGGNVQVNIINNAAGTQATAQKRTDSSGRSVIDVFIAQVKSAIASDISRGSGTIPAAISTTYGLNRAPGMY